MIRDRGYGEFDIEYEDGDREARVKEENIRLLDSGDRDDDYRSPSRRAAKIEEGSKVEAKYKGGSKWYKGKVIRDRGYGEFDIEYEDGDREARVKEENIRLLDSGDRDDDYRSPSRRAAKIEEGSKVEAKYKGGSKWYKGKVIRDRGYGEFDIEYEDGDREARVKEENIRLLDVSGRRTPARGGMHDLD